MDDTMKYIVTLLVGLFCFGILVGVIALEETRIKADAGAYKCPQGDE